MTTVGYTCEKETSDDLRIRREVREQIKLAPQETIQLLLLKLLIPRVIHISVLQACLYFAVFDVPFSSILPTLL